jgi:hypothetical protein
MYLAAQVGASTLPRAGLASADSGGSDTNYAKRYVELIVRSAVSWQQYVLDRYF